MQIDVSARLDGIDFAPKDILTEIIQNVRTIISTTQFSVPLDRRFGIDGTVIDLPLPVAMARISAEVIRAITEYDAELCPLTLKVQKQLMRKKDICCLRYRLL